MDFNDVISVAQKNKTEKQVVSYYQTKFAPMKKQAKRPKTLSADVKKFLARKKEEEEQKALEEKRKKENLFALRDHKAQSRINKHLKVCKSANKSVLADAIDNDNTAITIAGPSQPDEDDYGYVSQEAVALYDQFMDKYNKQSPEKSIFSNIEKRTVNDIASTKDRLKQVFKQQGLSGSDGHRRKRKTISLDIIKESEADEKVEANKIKEEDKNEKPKLKKKPLPPPIGYAELIKLAEKKQYEPVIIEVKPKDEELRPMTKRQQQEYMREKERKEQHEKNSDTVKKSSIVSTSTKVIKTQSNKIPKGSEKSVTPNPILEKSILKTALIIPKKINKPNDKHNSEKTDSSKCPSKNELLEERKKLETERKRLEKMRRIIEEEKKKLAQSRNKQEDMKYQIKSYNKVSSKPKVVDKEISYKDIKSQQVPSTDLKLQSSLANGKPKQFPSSDMKPMKHKQIVKKTTPNKRRMYDDYEDYDSDMNDFIDDGLEEDNEDYSKHISEIFGYDKNKYRQIDDKDDITMESNFAQQLKEEYVSTKIGIMEDLEDICKEALEKKRRRRFP